MSVEQTDQIDAIGVELASGRVILTITDHLDWHEPTESHFLLLQEKINSYLRFIESGELLDAYPDSEGRNVVISVVGKFNLSNGAQQFFAHASSIIKDAGIALEFEQLK